MDAQTTLRGLTPAAKSYLAAVHVADLFMDKQPGQFEFVEQDGRVTGIQFWCPCGCGALLGVRFPPWTWDGNRSLPTVSPSILHQTPGGCGWHGYLRAGVFEECC